MDFFPQAFEEVVGAGDWERDRATDCGRDPDPWAPREDERKSDPWALREDERELDPWAPREDERESDVDG